MGVGTACFIWQKNGNEANTCQLENNEKYCDKIILRILCNQLKNEIYQLIWRNVYEILDAVKSRMQRNIYIYIKIMIIFISFLSFFKNTTQSPI